VNVGIDPTIELHVLALRKGQWDILDFVYRAFSYAYEEWLAAEANDPPGPDELMDAFKVEYHEYLAADSACGWGFVVEPQTIEAQQQGTRELFTLTLQAPEVAVPTLFAVAVRDVNGPDGVFDTSELVLVHPMDAEPEPPEGF
jgi:hypothetical protein